MVEEKACCTPFTKQTPNLFGKEARERKSYRKVRNGQAEQNGSIYYVPSWPLENVDGSILHSNINLQKQNCTQGWIYVRNRIVMSVVYVRNFLKLMLIRIQEESITGRITIMGTVKQQQKQIQKTIKILCYAF